MKKLISAALAAIMVMSVFALTACGGGGGESKDYSDSKYIGSWKAVSVEVVGESGDLEDEFILTVNADGTGTLVGSGEESAFTWEPTDGGFKTKGDVKATFKDDGDNIKVSMLGMDLIFERQ